MKIRCHKDLEVFNLAFDAAMEIFQITKNFPKEEFYSLTDQIRRSSRSVGAQISESWGKRKYEPHFISKLTDADSEQLETQHWIEVSEECEYIDSDSAKSLLQKCESIGKMIQSMISKSSYFCKK